jgi:hypothetical protein
VSTEKIYVPKYEPEMLYAADYPAAPIAYYPDPYPYYYYPTAPYFAGLVTGAIWGATVDWVNHGIWNGTWRGNDININCNRCFNNINGRVNWNDVDWRHVDRSRIGFDRNQFNNVRQNAFNKNIVNNANNRVGNRVNSNSGNRVGNRISANDVRAARNSNNKVQINNNVNIGKKNQKLTVDNSRHAKNSGNITRARNNGNINRNNIANRNAINNQVRRPRPGEFADHRYRQPSPFGDIRGGRRPEMNSFRGRASMHFNRGGFRPHFRR